MKLGYYFVIMFFMLISIKSKCQTSPALVFTYDNAGNLIQRNITVVPTPPVGPPNGRLGDFSEDKKDSIGVVLFKVYPNPAKDKISVEGELPEGVNEANIFLFNNIGQELRSDVYTGIIKEINVSDLKAGLYYLKIDYSKTNSSNYKIIITN